MKLSRAELEDIQKVAMERVRTHGTKVDSFMVNFGALFTALLTGVVTIHTGLSSAHLSWVPPEWWATILSGLATILIMVESKMRFADRYAAHFAAKNAWTELHTLALADAATIDEMRSKEISERYHSLLTSEAPDPGPGSSHEAAQATT